MADFEVWSVLWFLCVMCVAPVKIQCQLVKVYGVCVIPCKQADTVHGNQQWQDMLATSMSTTDDAWHTDTFSCWCCQRARHSLDTAQNCLGPTGLQRSVCKLDAKNPTDDDKAHCMGLYGPFLYPLDMLHWSKRALLKLKHGWLHKTWNQKKDVSQKIYQLCPAKKMETLSSVKMTMANCLRTIIVHVLDFLDHGDTVGCVLLWYT